LYSYNPDQCRIPKLFQVTPDSSFKERGDGDEVEVLGGEEFGL
jgi:hypothetical protein